MKDLQTFIRVNPSPSHSHIFFRSSEKTSPILRRKITAARTPFIEQPKKLHGINDLKTVTQRNLSPVACVRAQKQGFSEHLISGGLASLKRGCTDGCSAAFSYKRRFA